MPRGGSYMTPTSDFRKGYRKRFQTWLSPDRQAALHNCLVIGIDFGTTFSGVSWATVAGFKEENINVITKWPGSNREQAKVPTQLFYEDGATVPIWGCEISNRIESLQWFKLLLLRDDDMWKDLRESTQLNTAKRMLREQGRTPEGCIADYLRALWNHTLKMILKAHPSHLIEALQFHVVLTVPAIWKDYARTAMKEAAEKAGILEYRSAGETTLTFAPEPEAAGLAALLDRETELSQETDPGDVFVICDAGGGTVDVITYEIEDTKPLQLREAVEGDGSVCGGIFIDEDFKSQCKARIGRKWYSFTPADIKTILAEEWESGIKSRYSLQDHRPFWTLSILRGPLSGADLNDTSRKPHIKNGYIYFPSSDIKTAFDTRAVPGLLKLVDKQIETAEDKGHGVTGIVLVGGLGSSPYIRERLEAEYSHRGIEICRSNAVRRHTAICRGAILKGLMEAPISVEVPNAPTILSTISRTCLGVNSISRFVEGVHRHKDKYLCPAEGIYKAKNQMSWYIEKGEEIMRASPIRKEFYRTYTKREDFPPSSFEVQIYQCENERPPKRLTSPGVTLHSTINFHLTGFEYDELESHKGPGGQRCKRFHYTLEMVPSGASTEISIECEGKRVGSENVSIQLN
ncbi:hypothetical protein ACN38_g441 [Penicillium nordicum]|uniref:Uncharacterized protein n=1 Tax=Penicillium nordicum TaxID=229535 RepID=A0A0M8PAF6_9EURO|nr:hypothetical protein ACN38_g441 [Penicillium nordicum]